MVYRVYINGILIGMVQIRDLLILINQGHQNIRMQIQHELNVYLYGLRYTCEVFLKSLYKICLNIIKIKIL